MLLCEKYYCISFVSYEIQYFRRHFVVFIIIPGLLGVNKYLLGFVTWMDFLCEKSRNYLGFFRSHVR